MTCDKCDNKATVFLTHLEGGQMKKTCLCESCAAEQGVADPLKFSMGAVAPPSAGSGQIVMDAHRQSLSCPVCHFSMKHLQKVGRLGCPECYSTFRDEVRQMLPNMHRGVTHKGRIPEGAAERERRRIKIAELTESLDAAIALENFEDAAALRDELMQLQSTAETAQG